MQPSQPSLERETAAAVSNVENLRAAGDIAQHGDPQLDTRDSTDVLTEPSTASPGAVDLTLTLPVAVRWVLYGILCWVAGAMTVLAVTQ